MYLFSIRDSLFCLIILNKTITEKRRLNSLIKVMCVL